MQKILIYSGSVFLLFLNPVYAEYTDTVNRNNGYVIMGKNSDQNSKLIKSNNDTNDTVDFFELSKKYDKSSAAPSADWGAELLTNVKPYSPEKYDKGGYRKIKRLDRAYKRGEISKKQFVDSLFSLRNRY